MQDLTEKYPELNRLLTDACSEFAERLNASEMGLSISSVSAKSYDGFIAHTNGGVRVMVSRSLAYHYENTGAEENIIAPYAESAQRDAAGSWLTDHPDLQALFDDSGASDPVDWLSEYFQTEAEKHESNGDLFGRVPTCNIPSERLRESWHDFESEYLAEGGEYWLCLTFLFYAGDHRRNVSDGKDEVFAFAGVNTDFTYGREKYLVSTFEETHTVESLNADVIAGIVDRAVASIAD